MRWSPTVVAMAPTELSEKQRFVGSLDYAGKTYAKTFWSAVLSEIARRYRILTNSTKFDAENYLALAT
jgi:hypothetical protein